MSLYKTGRRVLVVGCLAGTLALTACSGGGSGNATSSGTTGGSAAAQTITYLVDNSENAVNQTQALIAAFHTAHPEITVQMETRAQGTDGDNIVKTKLATGEMEDVFAYNSGSLFTALDPAKNLVDLTGEAYMANLTDSFKTAVTTGGKVYGVPSGTSDGGGILYNKKIYEQLGLKVPKTWDEFMANCQKIKDAGIAPVIQTYGDTWTSQLFVLADFYNISQQDAKWAENYTANKAKYADEPALTSFKRLQAVYDAGYLNKDFASATNSQGLQQLVDGTGAHYPMLTWVVGTYVALNPDAANYIGFFAQPGDDAAKNGLTAWVSGGVYIPTTTTGDKLAAAKTFLGWLATPAACEASAAALAPTGPYNVKGCSVPADSPQAVLDLQQYFTDGNVGVALEFLSPLKGPNLEKITVEVGSGMTPAAAGAAAYDEDVKKQAQQLALPGW
ncbi:MAG: extracellular solute-binding protein [Propionibacteriaceae bacterium]|jgi:raffinose/stachyose/melibiose transport system substrate-binding protein|nr:extracellular solute-binding protein [Propionibacteriaceae bacterium]